MGQHEGGGRAALEMLPQEMMARPDLGGFRLVNNWGPGEGAATDVLILKKRQPNCQNSLWTMFGFGLEGTNYKKTSKSK